MKKDPGSILSKSLSERLIRARGAFSQAEFARFLGIKHQQTYQRYEAGQIPSGEILHRIARRIGVSVDELLSPPTGDFPHAVPIPLDKSQQALIAEEVQTPEIGSEEYSKFMDRWLELGEELLRHPREDREAFVRGFASMALVRKLRRAEERHKRKLNLESETPQPQNEITNNKNAS